MRKNVDFLAVNTLPANTFSYYSGCDDLVTWSPGRQHSSRWRMRVAPSGGSVKKIKGMSFLFFTILCLKAGIL